MRRPWHIWLAFGLCVAVVIVVMAWLTMKVIRSDRAESLANRNAGFEENIRLALWRMDSKLGPLIAQESARPYFVYSAFYPADRAYAKMLNWSSGDNNRLAPSVLLTQPPQQVLLHFQIEPDGQITSPQVPEAKMLVTARPGLVDARQAALFAERLARLRQLIKPATLLAAIPGPAAPPALSLTFDNTGNAADLSQIVVQTLLPAPNVSAGTLNLVTAPSMLSPGAGQAQGPMPGVPNSDVNFNGSLSGSLSLNAIIGSLNSSGLFTANGGSLDLGGNGNGVVTPNGAAVPGANINTAPNAPAQLGIAAQTTANRESQPCPQAAATQPAAPPSQFDMQATLTVPQQAVGIAQAQDNSLQPTLQGVGNANAYNGATAINSGSLFNNSGNTYNNGTLILNGANSYTGQTVVGNGTLQNGSAAANNIYSQNPRNNDRPQRGKQQYSGKSNDQQQAERSEQEFLARQWAYGANASMVQQKAEVEAALDPNFVSEGPSQALWVGDALILARRVSVNGREYVQGCWLDWPAIRAWMSDEVRDLLPEAHLEPIIDPDPRASAGDDAARLTRSLATLPARLHPGANPIPLESAASPLRLSLWIAWGCALLATLAVGVLLQGAVSLSERRGAFVSSVTHELRTPLTTFRLYSEMLAAGMVRDPVKQQSYLATLKVEAARLGHLVENVLAYARLERGRPSSRFDNVPLTDLLQRATGRLADRAVQSKGELAVSVADGLGDMELRTDCSAVEQILFNLVDNACKYASSARDRRIHIEAALDGRRVLLRVRDHGPGISAEDAKRLFRPFSKSAREAAHTAPGIGLGLALCRRLARRLGGDLRLDRSVTDGACFVLTLPAAPHV